jgi:hypothetical protein
LIIDTLFVLMVTCSEIDNLLLEISSANAQLMETGHAVDLREKELLKMREMVTCALVCIINVKLNSFNNRALLTRTILLG